MIPPADVQRIVFPMPMSDQYYCFCMGFQAHETTGSAGYSDFSIYGRDAESICYFPETNVKTAVSWMVWGMAADGNSNGEGGE